MAMNRRTRDSLVVALTQLSMLVVLVSSLGALAVSLLAVAWHLF